MNSGFTSKTLSAHKYLMSFSCDFVLLLSYVASTCINWYQSLTVLSFILLVVCCNFIDNCLLVVFH